MDSLLRRVRGAAWLAAALALAGSAAAAQDTTKSAKFSVYGFAMLDAGTNTGQINPDWYDVLRPTKLPAYDNEFAVNGQAFFSVRQTRFGVKSWVPTSLGELYTIFEFDMFGVGNNAGQTTIRPRQYYGQIGHVGAGQTMSAFMDLDVFPNTLEYWGPNGMIFFRNLQIRYMPIMGPTHLVIALEAPGASADQGVYSGRIELSGIVPKFQYPDLTANYRKAMDWGYVQLGGVVRHIAWVDTATHAYNFSGSATGWGLTVSSNILIKKDAVRLQGVYGKGIQNYMNDAPVDIGLQNNFSSSTSPVIGVPLPMWSMVAFYDHTWDEKWTSSIGFSTLVIDNSDAQAPDAFHSGSYAAANIIYYPVPNMLVGLEWVWGQRTNNSDGWKYTDNRIAISFKYTFGKTFGGQ